MSESTNAPASSSTTPNPPILPESSPVQSELVKLLTGMLKGTRATFDQQIASLMQSGKLSHRHVLQVARIWLLNAS